MIFVMDILTSLLIGRSPPKIVRAAARRLNAMIPNTEAEYVHRLETLMEHHKMVFGAWVTTYPVLGCRTPESPPRLLSRCNSVIGSVYIRSQVNGSFNSKVFGLPVNVFGY